MNVQIEAIARKPFCELLHFRRDTTRRGPKVLVVAPLSGHHATLLRGTVEALLPEHDIYITDWRSAEQVSLAGGRFDLDDYIDYVIDFTDQLGPDVHFLAVCQPSVPVLAAVSLMSARTPALAPQSMTLMGGPIDTRVNPTEVDRFATTHSLDWFERTVITTVPSHYPGALRRVYPGFLQLSGFMAMNLERHVGSVLKHFEHMIRSDGESTDAHRRFYDEYLSVMDLTAEFYLQTLTTAFQEHHLPRGVMVSRGRKVEPAAIRTTALMTVEGGLDDISGIGQTYAAHGLCSNLPPEKRRHLLSPGVGHYGIFNGKKWRTRILPQVRDFIRTQSL